MANHKSATKASRQQEKKRIGNRQNRSRLRTQVKKLRSAIETADRAQAEELLKPTLTLLDHSASLGAIHRNTAARTKSRLALQVGRLATT